MQTQVWSIMMSLVAYMTFLAGFGLLCSTLAPSSQSASAWMVGGLVFYFIAPMVAGHWALLHTRWWLLQGESPPASFWWNLVEGLSGISVFSRMDVILATGFGGTAWSLQFISNMLAGLLCSGLAWFCFGVAMRSPTTEATSRGLVASDGKKSLFAAGHPWLNPFRWKDFHFVSGGTGMVCLRCLYYGILGIVLFALDQVPGMRTLFMYLLWFSVVVDAARVVSRSLQEEVRGQTLSSLTLLPHSLNDVVYSKLSGALLGWLPAPLFGLLIVAITPSFRESTYWFFTNSAITVLIFVMFTLFSALIPYFAALMSLYVRWGAVALGIGITMGVYLLVSMVAMLMFVSFGRAAFGQEIMLCCTSLVFLLICVACHVGILLRVQALATR